ncbi:MAG: clostripain-related cysteine peptidase [Candidatus Wallbacteria bacterium]|nr:clostripain-related cysteine peptidase [Candidatus Wallbacteria bacterium]
MKKLLLVALALFSAFFPLAAYEKNWTVMVFMNGDNELDSFASEDVAEMAKIGSDERIGIVVLQDHSGKDNTERHVIGKGAVVTEQVGEIDMGDWREAFEFFRWSVTHYPARHYLYIIWSHGSGWRKQGPPLFKGISSDAQSGRTIKTQELGFLSKAMHDHIGRRVDIIGYDACLMGMIEVAHETAGDAGYMVFSEHTEPGTGWPYDVFLAALTADPGMTPAVLSRTIVGLFADSYNGGTQGINDVTLSAIDCRRFENMMPKLTGFVDLLREHPDSVCDYVAAASQAQEFAVGDYKDLCDYLSRIEKLAADQEVKSEAGEMLSLLRGESPVITAAAGTGRFIGRAGGLSIYIPDRQFYNQELKTAYSGLKFAVDTAWDGFIEDLCLPQRPILKIRKVTALNENGDSVIAAGETVNFMIEISNEGARTGVGATLSIVPDSPFVDIDACDAAIPDVPAFGAVRIDGLRVRVSGTCQANQVVHLNLRITLNDRLIDRDYPLVVRKPFVTTHPVLLLARKSGDECVQYYTRALESAGFGFDQWDSLFQGPAASDILKRYAMVFVAIPASDDSPAVDPEALIEYLTSGGSLFISGQDLGEKFGHTAFFKEYLYSWYVQDNICMHRILGCNAMQGTDFAITGGDGAGNQRWPDEIDAVAPAQAIFQYAVSSRSAVSSGCGGLFVDTGLYKAVYLAFGLEGIGSAQARTAVLRKSADLLLPRLSEKAAHLAALERELPDAEPGRASIVRLEIERMMGVVGKLALQKLNISAPLVMHDLSGDSAALEILRQELREVSSIGLH